MSEKRIKLVTQQVWESGSAVHLPDVPVGTPVEIVYREEVEIRPGQRWVVNGRSTAFTVLHDLSTNKWGLHNGNVVIPLDGPGFVEDLTSWMSREALTKNLNEHATLAEGESE